jgi:molybdopterin converting factor small subunit
MEQVSLKAGATVSALLDYYGIAYERAHILVVNRHIASLETVLNDNDEVRVLPLAGGG